MENLLIFDSHAHIIPKLSGASGYSSKKEHLLIAQKSMHEHLAQPARRKKDNAKLQKKLWNDKVTGCAGKLEVDFRVGKYGRFEWTQDSEDCYIQYLPTYAKDMDYPVDQLKIMMDYAGVTKAVLQCGGVYGSLNDYYLKVITKNKCWDSIFYPLLRIQEKQAFHKTQLSILNKYIQIHNFKGLWFISDSDSFSKKYDRLWESVSNLKIPLFLPFFPDDKWTERVGIIEDFVKKFPSIPCVLPQAFPLSPNYLESNIKIDNNIKKIINSGNIFIEIIYPIGRGRIEDYPFIKSLDAFKTLYYEFGPHKLVWGSDIPMVERYCSYAQSLSYITNYCDWILGKDMKLILGENLENIFNPLSLI